MAGFFIYAYLHWCKIQAMSKQDTLHPFIFEQTDIRGNLVQLDECYQAALTHQQLPKVIHHALGELIAASVCLISTLKMDGALILQLQGKGKLKLLVVECDANLNIRATAKFDDIIDQETFLELTENGQFVITLLQKDQQPYQGIVALEGGSIADMLQNYMLRSQQIDTAIWLFADDTHASGMLIQKLPKQVVDSDLQETDIDAWQRINQLTNTITQEELATLTPTTILQRLYHEETVRLFDGRQVVANCSCSREGVANMLTMVGKQEIDSVIAEQGTVQINCDFCNKHYVFDEDEVEEVFSAQQALDETSPDIKH